jgi:hypothetical protein
MGLGRPRTGYASSKGQYKGILGERQSATKGRKVGELKEGAKLLDPPSI